MPALFKSFDKGTTQDYFVGAPKIAELNSQTTWTIEHKLGAYGIEHLAGENTHNPPGLFWRTMSNTLLEDPENLPYFTADGDQAMLNLANGVTSKYMANRNGKQLLMDQLSFFEGMPCNWWDWINAPLHCTIYDPQYWDAKSKRDAWQKGLDWMMNIDQTWKTIIGAVDWEITYQCKCKRSDDIIGDLIQVDVIPGINNGSDCIDYPLNHPEYDLGCNWGPTAGLVRKESDGIVLRESAQAYPGAAGYFEMDKSNHFQMRNDSNTKQALLWVYRSSLPGGSQDGFFKTDTK